jgi:hypothetical protein
MSANPRDVSEQITNLLQSKNEEIADLQHWVERSADMISEMTLATAAAQQAIHDLIEDRNGWRSIAEDAARALVVATNVAKEASNGLEQWKALAEKLQGHLAMNEPRILN